VPDITDYDLNPDDPDAIFNIAKKYYEAGKHDLALLFVEEGMRHCGDDAKMIAKLLEISSISGFYSKRLERKAEGKLACEAISMDRTLEWPTRNLARFNSTYYASSAVELMPSTRLTEVRFTPPDDYRPMNPSIACHDGKLWMIQRTVNYEIREDGSYDMRGDTAIRTRNHLLRLDDDLSVLSSEEILPPEDLPNPLYDMVIGWEDCRLFFWKGEPWCTSTVREISAEGACEMVLSRIVVDANGCRRFSDYRVVSPTFIGKQHEKNWMPMVNGDNLFFLYSNDPTRVIDPSGNLVASNDSAIASDSFRGGGQLVAFNGGWLAMIHESHYMHNTKRRYMHRFVWYDTSGKLKAYSEPFYLSKVGIEFVAGLAKHPADDLIIASFGVEDRSSWLATFDPSEIMSLLRVIP
jgi:hypothetical protein